MLPEHTAKIVATPNKSRGKSTALWLVEHDEAPLPMQRAKCTVMGTFWTNRSRPADSKVKPFVEPARDVPAGYLVVFDAFMINGQCGNLTFLKVLLINEGFAQYSSSSGGCEPCGCSNRIRLIIRCNILACSSSPLVRAISLPYAKCCIKASSFISGLLFCNASSIESSF